MKISVITPTYNRGDLIAQTIESVQKSIFLPLDISIEHIIYDDASTDTTEEVVKSLPYSNIVYIKGEKNMGPSHARNVALSKASGDYIFFIDSDDILLQRALYYFTRAALEHPETVWFVSDFLHVDTNLSYRIGDDYYTWDFKNPQEMLAAIFKGEHFIQSNVFIKRSLIESVGGYDETMKLSEDLDLYIRFLLNGVMPRFVPTISHLHRFHSSNLSQGITVEKHMEEVKKLATKYNYYHE